MPLLRLRVRNAGVTRPSELRCTNDIGLCSFCVFDPQDHGARAIHVLPRFWRSSICNVEPGGITNERDETAPTAARRRTFDADLSGCRAALRRACACDGTARGEDRPGGHAEAGHHARAASSRAGIPGPSPVRCCSRSRGCLNRTVLGRSKPRPSSRSPCFVRPQLSRPQISLRARLRAPRPARHFVLRLRRARTAGPGTAASVLVAYGPPVHPEQDSFRIESPLPGAACSGETS